MQACSDTSDRKHAHRNPHKDTRICAGVVTLIGCTIEHNLATEAGGALEITGGSLLLTNQTVLRNNTAPAGGLAHVSGGLLAYGLPAPLGYWVADSFVCEPAYKPCGWEGECVLTLQDSQPCDWKDNTEFILNVSVFAFAQGSTNGEYPYLCAAGYLGNGWDVLDQDSALCAALCPKGFICPAGTVQPIPCRLVSALASTRVTQDAHDPHRCSCCRRRGYYCPFGGAVET